MADTDDDGWEQAREMVRNAPPGTYSVPEPDAKQERPQAVEKNAEATEPRRERPSRPRPPPPPPRTFKPYLVLLPIAAVLGGIGFYAFRTDTPSGGTRQAAPSLPPSAEEQPAAKSAEPQTSAVAVRSAQPLPDAPPKQKSQPAGTLIIKRGLTSTNIRGDPSTAKPPIAKLNGGDRVEKLLERDPWLKVRFSANGRRLEGWIRKDLIEAE